MPGKTYFGQGYFGQDYPSNATVVAYTLVAGTGVFTLTGKSANLLVGRVVSAAQGSFILTGKAATFRRTYVLGAAAGSFSLTGISANLLTGRVLSCASGSFVLTGNDATLTLTAASTYTLSAQAGMFVLTGNAADLIYTPNHDAVIPVFGNLAPRDFQFPMSAGIVAQINERTRSETVSVQDVQPEQEQAEPVTEERAFRFERPALSERAVKAMQEFQNELRQMPAAIRAARLEEEHIEHVSVALLLREFLS